MPKRFDSVWDVPDGIVDAYLDNHMDSIVEHILEDYREHLIQRYEDDIIEYANAEMIGREIDAAYDGQW